MFTSKSMMFDGRFIEDLIPGYTTLNVTGREMAEIEVDALEVGSRDGAIFRTKKYKPRTLTIEFLLEGDDLNFNPDNTTLIARLNKLNGILETDGEVQIIFRDEPDKYYKGIRHGSPTATMALGVVKGSFQIYCADPFKYSVDPITVSADHVEEDGSKTFIIDYNGTHKSYPKFKVQFYTQNTVTNVDGANASGVSNTSATGDENEEIAGKGACGYVAFFDAKEDILQFGNPDATNDPETTDKKIALVDQNWQTLGTWGASTQQKWLANDSKMMSAGYVERGAFTLGASYSNSQSNTTEGTLLSNSAGNGVKYTVTYKASKRYADAVRFDVSITGTFTSAVAKKIALTAIVTIGGEEFTTTFKKATEEWPKGKKATATLAFVLEDLETYTDTIGSITFGVARSDSANAAGYRSTVNCNNALIPTYIENVVDSYYLTPNEASMSEAVNSKYYGPSLYRNIPADSAGNKGWTDFTADFHVKFAIGNGTNDVQQMGCLYAAVLTGDINGQGQLTNRKILAGVIIRKYQAGKVAYIDTIGNGSYIHTANKIDISYNNKYFGNNKDGVQTNKHIIISKSESTVTFTVGGEVYTWNKATATDKAYQITFAAMGYSGKPRIDWLGFYNVKFTPDVVDSIEPTIPFTTGDLLEADSATGYVYLNGVKRPELGALGNDWEKMCLVPGFNQISTAYSDWCNETAYRRCTSDEGFDPSASYYTKSGNTYTAASPTISTFTGNESTYYVLESCAPKFSIEYREVYS